MKELQEVLEAHKDVIPAHHAEMEAQKLVLVTMQSKLNHTTLLWKPHDGAAVQSPRSYTNRPWPLPISNFFPVMLPKKFLHPTPYLFSAYPSPHPSYHTNRLLAIYFKLNCNQLEQELLFGGTNIDDDPSRLSTPSYYPYHY